MKPLQMMLYICPACELLLIQLDEKEARYSSNKLDATGWYQYRDSSDLEHDEYICPACSTMELTKDGNGLTLTTITFATTETATVLLELWDKVKERGVPMSDYGIPLDTEELKGIIMEDSIGN